MLEFTSQHIFSLRSALVDQDKANETYTLGGREIMNTGGTSAHSLCCRWRYLTFDYLGLCLVGTRMLQAEILAHSPHRTLLFLTLL